MTARGPDSAGGGSSQAPSPLARSVASSFRFLRWAGIVGLVAVLISGVRVIGPDEVGLVIRFGRLAGETRAEQVHGPGLLFAAPYLIDRVVRVPVKKVQQVRIDRLIGKDKSDWVDITKDGYALTGDRGVVQLVAVMRYRIVDPVAYALAVAKPRAVVHDVATAALTRACAASRTAALLARGKKALARAVLAGARRRLTGLAIGVRLLSLELEVMRPPPQTARQFQDVQSAFIEQKTLVERAKSYAHQRVLMAKARARQTILSSQARGGWALAAARGKALAFSRLAAQQAKGGPQLLQRLYREAMEKIFKRVGARVIVPPGKGVVRLRLPAGATMLRPRTAPTAPASPWDRVPPKGER